MTLDTVIQSIERLEVQVKDTGIEAKLRRLRYRLEILKTESVSKISPDPEAEWITLETGEASFGFQKCCDAFLESIETCDTFAPYEHPKEKRPFIGLLAKHAGEQEIHYCPYCGVKINLDYSPSYYV
jgi:hypothetical protein